MPSTAATRARNTPAGAILPGLDREPRKISSTSSMGGHRRAHGPSAMLLLLLLLLVSLVSSEGAAPPRSPQHQMSDLIEASSLSRSQATCSKFCVAENCNNVDIRYGKYCGVGWTGCPGEKPCDELDACCQGHDECVGKKGLLSVECHEKLKSCIEKVKKSGKVGFSGECPYEVAMPTMINGMDLAIFFSQLGIPNVEL